MAPFMCIMWITLKVIHIIFSKTPYFDINLLITLIYAIIYARYFILHMNKTYNKERIFFIHSLKTPIFEIFWQNM